MNYLMRPALYWSYHEILPVTVNNRPEKTYDIVGPVCESGDKFCTSRTLPEMQAGDLVMIKSAGAYGFSMASNYNTRPLPAEILVENGHADIIRPRQTYDDLIGPDRIPDWLQA